MQLCQKFQLASRKVFFHLKFVDVGLDQTRAQIKFCYKFQLEIQFRVSQVKLSQSCTFSQVI